MSDTATTSKIVEDRVMVLLDGNPRGPMKTTERAAKTAGFPSQQDNIYYYDVEIVEELKERTCQVCGRLVSVCRNALRLPVRTTY